jgi:alkaline phosphatase
MHQALEDAVEDVDHLHHLVRRVVDHIDARGKGLVAVAGDHQHLGRGVLHRQVERDIHLFHGRDVEHVVGRTVDRQAQYLALVFVGDELEISHDVS